MRKDRRTETTFALLRLLSEPKIEYYSGDASGSFNSESDVDKEKDEHCHWCLFCSGHYHHRRGWRGLQELRPVPEPRGDNSRDRDADHHHADKDADLTGVLTYFRAPDYSPDDLHTRAVPGLVLDEVGCLQEAILWWSLDFWVSLE